jgi:hypothetical protein
MADYLTTTSELTSIANAIRAKGETTASLIFPTGFVTAINNIEINPIEVTVTNASVSKISGTEDDYRITMTS